MMHMQCFSKRLYSVTPRVLQQVPPAAASFHRFVCVPVLHETLAASARRNQLHHEPRTTQHGPPAAQLGCWMWQCLIPFSSFVSCSSPRSSIFPFSPLCR